jgi:hypothetical protein
MSECKWCGRKGFFVGINEMGVCKNCAPGITMEAQSRLRVITESSKIVGTSKKYETINSRLDVVNSNAEELLKYEKVGIPITNPLPSILMQMVIDDKDECTIKEIESQIEKAVQKSKIATTPAGKIGPLTKCFTKISEYKNNFGHIEYFDKYENTMNTLIHKTQYTCIIDKADKYEFKEQDKKAIDQYLEALYFLKKDDIDDSYQKDEISRLEEKISSLQQRINQPQIK